MKTRLMILPALLAVAALAPANADVALYAHSADAVHVNVFRVSSAQAADDPTGPEVSMFFGTLDVLVDPGEIGYPEEGGCIDIYLDGVFDSGCGMVTVEPDGVMGTTHLSGTIQSRASRYDPETGFEDLGPSTITIDLTVVGTGPIEVSPFTNYAVGVCGLPPDTRGVFSDLKPELQRDAAMDGTLLSQTVGTVDPTSLPVLLVKAFNVLAGACV